MAGLGVGTSRNDLLKISFDFFFDRAAVIKHVKDGTKSGLSKAGAFVRQRAKTTIRPRKRISDPGNPPSSHVGYLRDFLFFAYDPDEESVVVGPMLLNSSRRGGDKTVPELLEFGGPALHWSNKRPVYYRARPFMGPALEHEYPKFPEFFANVVTP